MSRDQPEIPEQSNDEGRAIVRRFMDDHHEAIFAHGEFKSLFEGWLEHTRLWKIEPDALASVMMRQALGGAALYASSRPRDETIAFTLNVRKPPLNLFFTADSGSCSVTGRAYTKDVKTAEASRLYVDSRRQFGKSFTSVIEVEGYDVLEILEQYCLKSDQASARFFELAESEFLMVASLPVDDDEWIQSLTLEAAVDRLGKLRSLDEKDFWLHCGCDPEKMLSTVRRMFAGRADELFEADESVVVSCPRCGRNWTIARESF